MLADPSATLERLQRTILTARPVRSSSTTRTAMAAKDLGSVNKGVAETLLATLASSTIKDRQRLWARYQNFVMDHNLDERSPITAVTFVEATDASIQSRLTYAKHLSAIFGKLQLPREFLSEYMTGLRKKGAKMPAHQATPITREHLLEVAHSYPPQDAAAIMLACKTASRWGDIASITTDHIIHRSPAEVIVYWGKETKGAKSQQFLPSSYTVVHGLLTDFIARHLRTAPRTPITSISRPALVKRMSEVLKTEHYTAHSIKRGALARLMSLPDIDLKMLARLAKHKSTLDEVTPTTIGYISSGPTALHTARALGTQTLTALL